MRSVISKQYAWLAAGLLFAFFWASASTATKIGLTVAQPLVIAIVRFGIASAILLFLAHAIKGYRLPSGKEWVQLSIYGFLNITVYLGLYVIAMQKVTAGIGALAVATNPVFISFLSVFFLGKKLTLNIFLALLLGSIGVVCAAWPLFHEAVVTTEGLLVLLLSMLSYSVGAIYFSARNWNGLHLFTINGWQTFIGGLLLFPFAWFYYDDSSNHFNHIFWSAVLWLAIPVSMVAVLLWLWLLKKDTINAGIWLFLCPVFGFTIAALIMNDRIDKYTFAGIALVILGLILSQRNFNKKTIEAVTNKSEIKTGS